MYQVTKDTLIIEVLENAPETAPFFNSIGMHCLTCKMASSETIGQACSAHGHDADEFLERLNKFIAELEV